MSEGITHIVTNAVDLNEAALRLARADQVRASDVLRGMAEEEAAKVLILNDAIRRPQQERGTTLKRFYDHLAKRIHAAASSELSIDSFEELRAFVDLQRRPRLLDGPNDVDWIVGNEVTSQ